MRRAGKPKNENQPLPVEEDIPYLAMPKLHTTPEAVRKKGYRTEDTTPGGVYMAHKTAKEYASEIKRDLPLGKVTSKGGKVVCTTLTTGDVAAHCNLKSTKTQQKVMDELAVKGVIYKRSGKPAMVAEKYQFHLPEEELIPDDRATVLKALESLDFKKAEAKAMVDRSKGATESEWLENALRGSVKPG